MTTSTMRRIATLSAATLTAATLAGGISASAAPAAAPAGAASIVAASPITSMSTRQLQMNLDGMLYPPGAIDGVYGTATANAVNAFQRDSCLTPDGQAGPATAPKIIAKVVAVQAKAGAPQTGVYDSATRAKVVAYQMAHGIPAGGQAGPQTMKTMGIVRVKPCSTGTSTVGGYISRTEVLARAKYWTDKNVPYSMRRFEKDPQGRLYRTDCSGFVSMAWHLSSSLTTVTLPDVSHRIAKAELRPGDVLLKGGPSSGGAYGHVVIFRGWANSAHTAYYASDESGSRGATQRTIPYPYFSGYGTFLPYRYNKITG